MSTEANRGWFEARLPLCGLYRCLWRDHMVAANLPLSWSLGPLIAVALGVLTLSGIWLGIAYNPSTSGAALSIAELARTMPYGWLMRDLHRDGTTMLFGVLFIELFRGMVYGTYRNGRELVWIIDIVRLFTCLALGFLGFAMTGSPAAQAAILVMAGHLAAIPLIGHLIGPAFLGGFGLSAATGPRIAMAHIVIGFLVLLIAALGLAASRIAPQANPDGIARLEPRDLVPQSAYAGQYFTAFLVFALIFAAIIGFAPGMGTPHGPILPTSLALPVQVVPPWYLLVFHGLARVGASAGGGLLLTVAAFVLLGALPWLDRGRVASGRYRPVYAGFVILLAIDLVVLTIAAAQPAQGIWPAVIDLSTIYAFAHFLIITPLVTMLEHPHEVPVRLSGRIV